MPENLLVGPLIIAIIVWLWYLYKAFEYDRQSAEKIKQHQLQTQLLESQIDDPTTLIELVKHEARYNKLNHSKFKKLLIDSRDSVLRGAILGALSGGFVGSIETSISWALSGGILSGVTDYAGWTPALDDGDR